MTPLAVGDVCEVVGSTLWPEWNGRQVVVVSMRPMRDGGVAHKTAPMPKGHPARPGSRFTGWRRERLRKIDPPDFRVVTPTAEELRA
jgi:hypothetical protein